MQINRSKSKVCGFSALVFLVTLSVAGCHSSSSAPPTAQDLTWHLPGTGSLYVETHYHGSLTSNLQGSEDAHYYVNEIGSYAGKPNTFKLDSSEEYFAFESNGDYSVLDSAWGLAPSDWQRFPTGQGSPIVQTGDTIYAPDSVLYLDTTHVHKTATRSYVDVENITDATTDTYATFKIHEVITEVDSVVSFQHPSTPQTITYTNNYWIGPTIGWIVRDSSCNGTTWTRKLLAGCTVY